MLLQDRMPMFNKKFPTIRQIQFPKQWPWFLSFCRWPNPYKLSNELFLNLLVNWSLARLIREKLTSIHQLVPIIGYFTCKLNFQFLVSVFPRSRLIVFKQTRKSAFHFLTTFATVTFFALKYYFWQQRKFLVWHNILLNIYRHN